MNFTTLHDILLDISIKPNPAHSLDLDYSNVNSQETLESLPGWHQVLGKYQ
jgi:hypothetical protein